MGRLDWTKKNEPPILEPPLIIVVKPNGFLFERDGVRLSTENILGELDEHGELFSSTSGKRLLPDSDVRLNKKYYLLTNYRPGKLINPNVDNSDPDDFICAFEDE